MYRIPKSVGAEFARPAMAIKRRPGSAYIVGGEFAMDRAVVTYEE